LRMALRSRLKWPATLVPRRRSSPLGESRSGRSRRTAGGPPPAASIAARHDGEPFSAPRLCPRGSVPEKEKAVAQDVVGSSSGPGRKRWLRWRRRSRTPSHDRVDEELRAGSTRASPGSPRVRRRDHLRIAIGGVRPRGHRRGRVSAAGRANPLAPEACARFPTQESEQHPCART